MVVAIVALVTGARVLGQGIEAAGKRRAERQDGGASKELEGMRGDRKLLVERIENLETIVCGVDLELNQKLHKLIDEQRLLTTGAAVAAREAALRRPGPGRPATSARSHPRRRRRTAPRPVSAQGSCRATCSRTATGSSACSARAGWARCTSRTTRCSATWSRSR